MKYIIIIHIVTDKSFFMKNSNIKKNLKVPYTDFTTYINSQRKQLVEAFEDCLISGRYVNGPICELFEKKLSKYCGVKYSTGIASGTCALNLSLKALGIKKGDEIIIPGNSFIATSNSIELNNGKVVFAEIDEDLNIDPKDIINKITKKTKAIMPVHLCGRPAKIDQIKIIAKKYNLFLIEDAAQSIGASLNNKKVGSFGDLACFSFHPLKNLHTYGDSGAVVSNNKKLIHEISRIKNHGLLTRENCVKPGYNCRLDEIHASILNVQIKNLDLNTKKRRNNAFILNDLLSRYVEVPFENKNEKHVYQTYVIKAEKRDKLFKYLRSNEVECLIHYPIPTHKQDIYKSKKISLKKTEQICKKIISLPLYPSMKIEQIEKMSNLIKNFYN